MNPGNVPEPLIGLLPLAEDWGIRDDVERADAVERASFHQLASMVEAVDAAEDEGLYDWLSGDESHAADPTEEYVAITCLTMAADAARLRLARTGEGSTRPPSDD